MRRRTRRSNRDGCAPPFRRAAAGRAVLSAFRIHSRAILMHAALMISGQRKLLLIVASVGVPLLCLMMVWPLRQPPETPVKSSFLGFTNETLNEVQLTNVTLALFGVRNFPTGPSPELRDIAYKQNGRWQSRGVPPGMLYSVRIDTNDFTRQIMALPVASTNQPTQFVFEFPEEDGRP